MSQLVKDEFNRFGLKLGDVIEVELLGAVDNKARFEITEEIFNSSHFPLKLATGEIIYCHLDHIDKTKITIISRKN